ncbi:hypothetical protein [Dichotomicrobium thermohalophilum]|uniref:Uncharacterized protein n=1 Tax=Dichotomicrobium thermohalophilum TaxID=933063 RepID=A0A397Q2S7_9HYPH|nr:hypothetical protein [Dichotomicrobium thermohalophilum]RIA55442.1 hypothetical protein BXY53_0507 [Dichotomicrobium thermohalophilum]
MSQQPEQDALQRAVAQVGYLHQDFSVEVTTADQLECSEQSSKAKMVIVRNEVTKAWHAYRRGRGQAWLDAFRRDLTAGAFN